MDEAERDDQARTASVGTRQRRNWRTRRQAAGLVEAAVTDMVRHERQGQTNPVAVELLFSGVPPAVFRKRLTGRVVRWLASSS